MDIQKLTKEQAVIITGFTGILCGEFSDFHADVEKRLGRGVQTFEMGMKSFMTDIKRLYEADFIEMGTVSKEEAKAQAVPDGFVVVSQKDLLELTIAINAVDLATHTESKTNEVRGMWQQVALKLMALGTAQELVND